MKFAARLALVLVSINAAVQAALQPCASGKEKSGTTAFTAPSRRDDIPAPPKPEPIKVVEIPLPPVITDEAKGCTTDINSRKTGCIGKDTGLQNGNFLPDGNHVVAILNFTGAPAAPDPAIIYVGLQLVVIKIDGLSFSNGDSWKCVTCGVPPSQQVGRAEAMDYPQVFRDGKLALVGTNIVDCGNALLSSDECTPEKVHVYPIRWNTTPDGSGPGGDIRELRIHPDNVHLGFNSFTSIGGILGQLNYFGHLEFNPSPSTGEPSGPRYDLVNVYGFLDKNGALPIHVEGDQLHVNYSALTVGELRGFSGTGSEVTYIGYPAESSTVDVFAADLQTGKIRRLTSHPEYVDPVDISADDEWTVVMDTRGTGRQMFLAGMRNIPPLTDLVSTSATSSTRNNGRRRFFQPWLIDRYGDRGDYFGQQINGKGDGSPGSINDPNWNGRADPKWSPDGTKIVYWQELVLSLACGGGNPLPCPNSTAEGGRYQRLMLAHLTSRKPKPIQPVVPVSDVIPWGTRYVPGTPAPDRVLAVPGNYTLKGKATGYAKVQIIAKGNGTVLETVAVKYTDFSDNGIDTLNGYERVTRSTGTSFSVTIVDWYSNLISTGETFSTKVTSPDGFHLEIDVLTNIFEANGTLTTTVDGKVYRQPANGT